MTEARKGDWMQTFTGVQFWPLDPRPEDVNIFDIAHALSNICRFGGHSSCFYSVAEHSVIVSEHVTPQNKMAALLHDATEAYLGDMIRPLKRCMSEYRAAEDRLHAVIFERFGLPSVLAAEIKMADNRLLLNEKAILTGPEPAPWGLAQVGASEPLHNINMRGLIPEDAEAFFLSTYEAITASK